MTRTSSKGMIILPLTWCTLCHDLCPVVDFVFFDLQDIDMARPTKEFLRALEESIEAMEAKDASYQWGHMGQCNCGHLVHALTKVPRAEIHSAALKRAGDWGQQAIDYCPTSGYPLDHIITTMLEAGMDIDDIDNLERLDDKRVLDNLPRERRYLTSNSKEDAILYMKTWLEMLRTEATKVVGLASVTLGIQDSHDARQLV